MDIGLPGMSGIEGTRRLKERFPKMVLLAHTVYDDDERIFDALCAGASGYLLKKNAARPPVRRFARSSQRWRSNDSGSGQPSRQVVSRASSP